MHGINFDVVSKTCAWLESGDTVWFVTIIETWGASPRPVGSLFAFNPAKNLIAGSLSGGCIEDELLKQLQAQSDSNRAVAPFRMRYGDSPEEQKRFQLPCGGAIELVVELLSPDQLPVFLDIESRLRARQLVKRSLDLRSGRSSIEHVAGGDHHPLQCSDSRLSHVLGPAYHLLIVGAGEICRYLIPLAQSLDFSVTVCDPRQEILDRKPLQDVKIDGKEVEILSMLPDDLVRESFTDSYSAIVALSHDPRVDDLALLAALETRAFYIGAMGSQRTSENRRSRLLSLGIPEASLERLHAPVGLDIGSKTPPEIAISVAAELIEQRSGNKS